MAFLGIGMVVPVRVLDAQSRGASLAIIGAMASSYLLSQFVFQYPVGWLADMVGKKLVMIGSLAGMAVLTLIYLLVTDPVLFVALRVLEGAISAGTSAPARAILAEQVPDENRGEAYGVFGAFMNSGFLLGPAAGGFLAATGYNSAFIASAAFRLLAVLIVILFVHGQGRTQPEARERARAVPRRALWSIPLIGAYILVFGDFLYLGFDLTLMPLWMRHHLGATITLIGLGYAIWAVPNVLLSPFGGRLADRVRRSTLIFTFGLAQVPFYVAWGLITSLAPIFVLFALHGTVYAFMQPAVDSNLAAFSPPDARARAQSIYTAVGMASAFLAANVLSLLYGINFRLPLFVIGSCFAVCVLVGGTLVRIGEERREVGSSTGRSAAAD